jgi:hypothetical protein
MLKRMLVLENTNLTRTALDTYLHPAEGLNSSNSLSPTTSLSLLHYSLPIII